MVVTFTASRTMAARVRVRRVEGKIRGRTLCRVGDELLVSAEDFSPSAASDLQAYLRSPGSHGS